MKKSFSGILLSLLLGLSVLSLSGCAKDFVSGKKTLNFYSLKSDIKLGQYVMQSQLNSLVRSKKKLDLTADAGEYQRIRRIAMRVASVSHVPNFPYEIHLADLPVVNAWCAPGGKIMFYTGLWESRKGLVHKGNDDEIAAVMAHEIAHATARHVTERISSLSAILLVGEIAASIISEAGSPAGGDNFRRIFYEGLNIYVPSYSRRSESEADRIGLIYMAKAGFNPQAAVNLWERAAKANKDDHTSIYASHPSSGARAKALKALLPEAMEIYNAGAKRR